MTNSKREKLEEIKNGGNHIYKENVDFLITELSASWSREEKLVEALQKINEIHWSEISLDKERYDVNEVVKKALSDHKAALEGNEG